MEVRQLQVNTSALKNDADGVKNCILKMQTSMAAMKNAVEVLDRMWDGPSSEAFKESFHEDMDALEGLLKNLEKIQLFEADAEEKYTQCERKVYGLISDIKG